MPFPAPTSRMPAVSRRKGAVALALLGSIACAAVMAATGAASPPQDPTPVSPPGDAPKPTRPGTTMKAIRFHSFGEADVLQYEDAPVPRPGRGEMLVQVHAAGVNPVDWKVRKGYGKDFNPALPQIPGFDVSGVVASLGEGVTRFKKGDAVFAYLSLKRGGAYAEYAIVREDEAALKPSKIDHVQAAAIPLAALTAWQALYDTAGLSAGQNVLIHGAAGGVGTFAVQLAKARGANVIGTASESNQAFLREIGADRTVDYRARKFEEVVKDVDVVLDTVGGDTLERSFKVVKPGGRIVSIVDNPARFQTPGISVRASSILVKPDAEELAKIASMVDEGKIKPFVSEIVPLAEARRAHELSQGGHTRGKIVLRVVE